MCRLLDGARTGNDELGKLGLEPAPKPEKKEKTRQKVDSKARPLCHMHLHGSCETPAFSLEG